MSLSHTVSRTEKFLRTVEFPNFLGGDVYTPTPTTFPLADTASHQAALATIGWKIFLVLNLLLYLYYYYHCTSITIFFVYLHRLNRWLERSRDLYVGDADILGVYQDGIVVHHEPHDVIGMKEDVV